MSKLVAMRDAPQPNPSRHPHNKRQKIRGKQKLHSLVILFSLLIIFTSWDDWMNGESDMFEFLLLIFQARFLMEPGAGAVWGL